MAIGKWNILVGIIIWGGLHWCVTGLTPNKHGTFVGMLVGVRVGKGVGVAVGLITGQMPGSLPVGVNPTAQLQVLSSS